MLNLEKYDVSIQNVIKYIEEKRYSEFENVLNKAIELEEYAKQHHDTALFGYALFSKGFCYYSINDSNEAFEVYSRAINPLFESGQWELAARCYSTLGILSSGQGNVPMAMDYYLQGLSLCEEYNVESIYIFINCNIGVLYLGFHDIKNAINYTNNAINRVNKVNKECGTYEHIMSSDQVATLYLNLANCYCMQKDYELAQHNIDIADMLEKQMPDESLRIGIMMQQAQIYALAGMGEELEDLVHVIDDYALSLAVVLDVYDDVISYCGFLLEIGKKEEFWRSVSHLEELVKQTKSMYLLRKITELKIDFYKRTGNNKEYLMAAGLYYELSMKMEQEQNRSYRETLSTRLRLEQEKRTRKEAEIEAANLRMRSECDALTGLHNRYKITMLWEEYFHYCKQNHLPIAIEILDVDHFKQYNDNYGHQAGDIILQQVAGAIKSQESHQGIFTGRYGGDEFLIIYVNHTYEEVIGYAQELKDKVEAMKIKHEYSKVHEYISISQGIHQGYLLEETQLWEFLYAADHALYHIKEQGRNNYCVTTEK